ncbi:MAG: T9SS type A sorting domain-containing protein [Ignavibacteriota bacterium]|nr:MAG: T9SS type A sorting domain-containing protein [Ignavibacteriota bacterium]
MISGFSLSDAYPNPFNPTTTIRYEIGEYGYVSLKVYNILGIEVATLVNEEKQAGNYEVEFNSVETSHDLSLPSGIYLYQLKVGSYSETKKMVLLK